MKHLPFLSPVSEEDEDEIRSTYRRDDLTPLQLFVDSDESFDEEPDKGNDYSLTKDLERLEDLMSKIKGGTSEQKSLDAQIRESLGFLYNQGTQAPWIFTNPEYNVRFDCLWKGIRDTSSATTPIAGQTQNDGSFTEISVKHAIPRTKPDVISDSVPYDIPEKR